MSNKREIYKNKIDSIAKESFNNEQKIIAKHILDSVSANKLDEVYTLISQRVKTGFVFDAAPEVNHDAVAIVKENKDLFISSDSKSPNYIEHKLIIGENYDALKNLLVTYVDPITNEGLVDLIYIDPPYGTEKAKEDGNDYKEEIAATKFIYRDKYTRDGWLNLMNERIKLSHKILSNKGIIFVSIDDGNHAYLKVLMDEIFGENNFITSFVWQKKKGGGQAKYFYEGHEYILCYAKIKNNIDGLTIPNTDISESKIIKQNGIKYYVNDDIIRKVHGKYEKGTERRCHYEELLQYKGVDKKNEVDQRIANGEYILVPSDTEKGKNYVARLEKLSTKRKKVYSVISNWRTEHGNEDIEKIFGFQPFENPKPVELMKFILQLNNNDKSIILDFFAGSGTTAQAVMELNAEDGGSRQCILVTNNENNIAKDITWERLYRIIHGKGSNNEQINWSYSKELPSLVNNEVRTFEIEYHDLTINDFDKARMITKVAENEFKKLNYNYKRKNKLDIYNDLYSLNPIKKVE